MDIIRLFIAQLLIFILMMSSLGAKGKKLRKKTRDIKPIGIELSNEPAVIIKGKKITLGEAICLALEQNHDIITGSYDVAMTDSDFQRYLKNYSVFFNFENGIKYQEFPNAMGASFVGKDQKSWDISAAVARRFSTGTTLSAGMKQEYVETTYEPIILGETSLTFNDPKYFRPVIFVSIEQDLLKNIFGYSEKRQQEILRNAGLMKHDALIYKLSLLVIGVISDYWTVVAKKTELNNAELQLMETIKVRRIIEKNISIGMAESFELNFYNVLIASAEGKKTKVRQDYMDSLRNFFRVINLSGRKQLTENAVFSNKLRYTNKEEAIKIAFSKRVDYNNLLRTLQNARLALEICENDALPSLSAGLTLSSMGQRGNMFTAYSDTGSITNPALDARIKMSYPLDDRVQKINVRNARYNLKQARIQLEKCKVVVRDDVISKIENISTTFEIYNKMKLARLESEKYYKKIVTSLSRGRFTAAVVKNALDALIDSRQRELGTLINYNIALIKFDVVKNELFEKYKIDINKYIPK